MKIDKVIQQFNELADSDKKRAAKLISLLHTKKSKVTKRRTSKIKLSDEKAVGMWSDRTDIKDSKSWVKKMRDEKWHRES